jgi:hypothetical protein
VLGGGAGATSAGAAGGYAGICACATSLCSAIGAPASAAALTTEDKSVLHHVLHVTARGKSAFRALPVMNTLERQTIPVRAPALGAG